MSSARTRSSSNLNKMDDLIIIDSDEEDEVIFVNEDGGSTLAQSKTTIEDDFLENLQKNNESEVRSLFDNVVIIPAETNKNPIIIERTYTVSPESPNELNEEEQIDLPYYSVQTSKSIDNSSSNDKNKSDAVQPVVTKPIIKLAPLSKLIDQDKAFVPLDHAVSKLNITVPDNTTFKKRTPVKRKPPQKQLSNDSNPLLNFNQPKIKINKSPIKTTNKPSTSTNFNHNRKDTEISVLNEKRMILQKFIPGSSDSKDWTLEETLRKTINFVMELRKSDCELDIAEEALLQSNIKLMMDFDKMLRKVLSLCPDGNTDKQTTPTNTRYNSRSKSNQDETYEKEKENVDISKVTEEKPDLGETIQQTNFITDNEECNVLNELFTDVKEAAKTHLLHFDPRIPFDNYLPSNFFNWDKPKCKTELLDELMYLENAMDNCSNETEKMRKVSNEHPIFKYETDLDIFKREFDLDWDSNSSLDELKQSCIDKDDIKENVIIKESNDKIENQINENKIELKDDGKDIQPKIITPTKPKSKKKSSKSTSKSRKRRQTRQKAILNEPIIAECTPEEHLIPTDTTENEIPIDNNEQQDERIDETQVCSDILPINTEEISPVKNKRKSGSRKSPVKKRKTTPRKKLKSKTLIDNDESDHIVSNDENCAKLDDKNDEIENVISDTVLNTNVKLVISAERIAPPIKTKIYLGKKKGVSTASVVKDNSTENEFELSHHLEQDNDEKKLRTSKRQLRKKKYTGEARTTRSFVKKCSEVMDEIDDEVVEFLKRSKKISESDESNSDDGEESLTIDESYTSKEDAEGKTLDDNVTNDCNEKIDEPGENFDSTVINDEPKEEFQAVISPKKKKKKQPWGTRRRRVKKSKKGKTSKPVKASIDESVDDVNQTRNNEEDNQVAGEGVATDNDCQKDDDRLEMDDDFQKADDDLQTTDDDHPAAVDDNQTADDGVKTLDDDDQTAEGNNQKMDDHHTGGDNRRTADDDRRTAEDDLLSANEDHPSTEDAHQIADDDCQTACIDYSKSDISHSTDDNLKLANDKQTPDPEQSTETESVDPSVKELDSPLSPDNEADKTGDESLLKNDKTCNESGSIQIISSCFSIDPTLFDNINDRFDEIPTNDEVSEIDLVDSPVIDICDEQNAKIKKDKKILTEKTSNKPLCLTPVESPQTDSFETPSKSLKYVPLNSESLEQSPTKPLDFSIKSVEKSDKADDLQPLNLSSKTDDTIHQVNNQVIDFSSKKPESLEEASTLGIESSASLNLNKLKPSNIIKPVSTDKLTTPFAPGKQIVSDPKEFSDILTKTPESSDKKEFPSLSTIMPSQKDSIINEITDILVDLTSGAPPSINLNLESSKVNENDDINQQSEINNSSTEVSSGDSLNQSSSQDLLNQRDSDNRNEQIPNSSTDTNQLQQNNAFDSMQNQPTPVSSCVQSAQQNQNLQIVSQAQSLPGTMVPQYLQPQQSMMQFGQPPYQQMQDYARYGNMPFQGGPDYSRLPSQPNYMPYQQMQMNYNPYMNVPNDSQPYMMPNQMQAYRYHMNYPSNYMRYQNCDPNQYPKSYQQCSSQQVASRDPRVSNKGDNQVGNLNDPRVRRSCVPESSSADGDKQLVLYNSNQANNQDYLKVRDPRLARRLSNSDMTSPDSPFRGNALQINQMISEVIKSNNFENFLMNQKSNQIILNQNLEEEEDLNLNRSDFEDDWEDDNDEEKRRQHLLRRSIDRLIVSNLQEENSTTTIETVTTQTVNEEAPLTKRSGSITSDDSIDESSKFMQNRVLRSPPMVRKSKDTADEHEATDDSKKSLRPRKCKLDNSIERKSTRSRNSKKSDNDISDSCSRDNNSSSSDEEEKKNDEEYSPQKDKKKLSFNEYLGRKRVDKHSKDSEPKISVETDEAKTRKTKGKYYEDEDYNPNSKLAKKDQLQTRRVKKRIIESDDDSPIRKEGSDSPSSPSDNKDEAHSDIDEEKADLSDETSGHLKRVSDIRHRKLDGSSKKMNVTKRDPLIRRTKFLDELPDVDVNRALVPQMEPIDRGKKYYERNLSKHLIHRDNSPKSTSRVVRKTITTERIVTKRVSNSPTKKMKLCPEKEKKVLVQERITLKLNEKSGLDGKRGINFKCGALKEGEILKVVGGKLVRVRKRPSDSDEELERERSKLHKGLQIKFKKKTDNSSTIDDNPYNNVLSDEGIKCSITDRVKSLNDDTSSDSKKVKSPVNSQNPSRSPNLLSSRGSRLSGEDGKKENSNKDSSSKISPGISRSNSSESFDSIVKNSPGCVGKMTPPFEQKRRLSRSDSEDSPKYKTSPNVNTRPDLKPSRWDVRKDDNSKISSLVTSWQREGAKSETTPDDTRTSIKQHNVDATNSTSFSHDNLEKEGKVEETDVSQNKLESVDDPKNDKVVALIPFLDDAEKSENLDVETKRNSELHETKGSDAPNSSRSDLSVRKFRGEGNRRSIESDKRLSNIHRSGINSRRDSDIRREFKREMFKRRQETTVQSEWSQVSETVHDAERSILNMLQRGEIRVWERRREERSWQVSETDDNYEQDRRRPLRDDPRIPQRSNSDYSNSDNRSWNSRVPHNDDQDNQLFHRNREFDWEHERRIYDDYRRNDNSNHNNRQLIPHDQSHYRDRSPHENHPYWNSNYYQDRMGYGDDRERYRLEPPSHFVAPIVDRRGENNRPLPLMEARPRVPPITQRPSYLNY